MTPRKTKNRKMVAAPSRRSLDGFVRLSSLFEGDRFLSHDALWTYLGPTGNGTTATARKHSKESLVMGHDGYGYIGDSLCSFMLDSIVQFISPNDKLSHGGENL